MNNQKKSAVRVGIGGPVGAGKTSFTAAIVKDLKQRYSVGVITNDIYTKEDAEALMRMQILPRRASNWSRNWWLPSHSYKRRCFNKPCCSGRIAATS